MGEVPLYEGNKMEEEAAGPPLHDLFQILFRDSLGGGVWRPYWH